MSRKTTYTLDDLRKMGIRIPRRVTADMERRILESANQGHSSDPRPSLENPILLHYRRDSAIASIGLTLYKSLGEWHSLDELRKLPGVSSVDFRDKLTPIGRHAATYPIPCRLELRNRQARLVPLFASAEAHETEGRRYRYTVVIEQDEDGVYISSCPALQGCHSYGDTCEEALESLKEAIQLHIEARQSIGEPIPIEVAVDRVEVTIEAAPRKTA